MWSALGKGDMGCTRGGGKDGMGVFKDAGLHFSSSLGANTSPRQGEPRLAPLAQTRWAKTSPSSPDQVGQD